MHDRITYSKRLDAPEERILDHLTFLYGEAQAAEIWPRLRERMARFRSRHPQTASGRRDLAEQLTEQDAVLITYGDQIREPDAPPLQSLFDVLHETIDDIVTGVHILPFFPYSSDDGFSVIDYKAVDPELGSWGDVRRLDRHFKLMFDAVINHISAESAWFERFKAGDPEYEDFFIVVDPETTESGALSDVVRPRARPLLTPVETAEGEKLVWTTFSDDQIDLNFSNPEVLLRIVDVLLFYVEQGATLIRLDAIAYLWKEIGTSCIHLEETHRVVKLFRAIFDAVAPQVILITETNVPHAENVSYFGDGTDEAQLVYQFPLPPLVFHAIATGDATRLSAWADGLHLPSPQTTFFNFLASHDGIGVRPVEGILSPEEVQALVERVKDHGGYVSYKTNADGSRSVYELNISYFDALSDPQADEPPELQVRRFVVSQAIMLALQGLPGIYVHSLFGSRSYREGVEETGRYRTINREKFDRAALEATLATSTSLRARVFAAYHRLLTVRRRHPAFHPAGAQKVLAVHPTVFILRRTAPDEREELLCLHNVSGNSCSVRLSGFSHKVVRDIIGGQAYTANSDLALELAPYEVLWLQIFPSQIEGGAP